MIGGSKSISGSTGHDESRLEGPVVARDVHELARGERGLPAQEEANEQAGKRRDGEREGRKFARRLTTIPGNGEKEQGGARLSMRFSFHTTLRTLPRGGREAMRSFCV
jgi:hypothetical protein